MNLKELLNKKEEIKFKIKTLILKINEIRNIYLPSRSSGIVARGSGTSFQEIAVMRIDDFERKLKDFQNQEKEIDEKIEIYLTNIDPKSRWIVMQRFAGKNWKEIECNGLSVGYIRKKYKKAIESLEKMENELD